MNNDIVECKPPLLVCKFHCLCIGSAGVTAFIMFIVFTLIPDLRPPDAPPASPMIVAIMGAIALLLSAYFWQRGDAEGVRADAEGIRFGRSRLVKWHEVATCSMRNFATRSNPDGVAFVLEDADGNRLFSLSSVLFYPPDDAQRFVRYVKLKLADKISYNTNEPLHPQ